VLEIASGTGQHLAALAAHRPDLTFRPTDPDPARRGAIDARCRGLSNVAAAEPLDAGEAGWSSGLAVEAVLVVNLLHLISEAELAVLLDEATRALVPGGLLAIYGPFLREGVATSEGDARFDAELRAQHPEIGLKELEVVTQVLKVLDLGVRRVEMPANNVMLLGRAPVRAVGL
jgi:SAM-dependent methyltransferase